MFDERSTDAPTSASIASAKAHQQAERSRVEAATGLRIADDGVVRLPSYTIVCPYCLDPIGGENRGKADRAFARHVVTVHKPDLMRSAS